ncbi:peroxidase-like [Anticarsia gemmatalis]|uniref:peroxidase-like n=1 Tax=Anticarsia gemmatalis TaxID=129554 RepID=UPI003F76C42A
MFFQRVFVLFFLIVLCNAIYYDYFTSKRLNQTMVNYYNSTKRLSICAKDIKKCDTSERRRVDGTCNNPDYPMRGAFTQPLHRLLPAAYFNGSYARKAVSGKDLPIPRTVRVELLCQGKSVHVELTHAVPGFAVFIFGDIGSTHDIRFFLLNVTDCCGKNKGNYMCTPNIIPETDPVHRFSNIRCMNMTRPLTYQYFGCTNESIPYPVEQSTASYDLSQVYNALNNDGIPPRAFVDGRLTVEVDNGVAWPVNGSGYCPANDPRGKCFKYLSNSLLSIQLYSTWFLRHHNHIASGLKKINPCWDDDTLYMVARDINIAFYQQIYIYEFLVVMMGRKELMKYGIIDGTCGFRDLYVSKLFPSTTLEFSYIMRWFHIMQHGTAKMYDVDGTFLKDYPMMNTTFRTQVVTEGKNIFYLTQGHFRQPTAKGLHSVDYNVAEMGLPYVQAATDIPTSDLHKSRLLGLAPYIDYLHMCFGYNITKFEDLIVVMGKERIILLSEIYEHVKDIDLMAGLWSEAIMKGGRIPPTLSCLIGVSLIKYIKGDRHWFERKDRPHGFTHDQLQEIRKARLSTLLCIVGDGVTQIQKNVFLNISPKNPLINCKSLPKPDLCKWADPKCNSDVCSKS